MKDDGNKLKKSLGSLDIFSISAGAMISSGLFILPAVVYPRIGPSIIVAYFLASLFVVPSLLAKAELSSAMPKSGGVYFYITRSFGTLMGIFTGLAAWFSLSLKSAFALIGIGIFLQPLLADYSPNMIKIVAVVCTIVFTVLNIMSVKETGRMQIIMVFILLSLILFYVLTGFPHIQVRRYIPFNPSGWQEVLAVTGIIFVSFTGLTNVASIAEEAKNPGKTIPRGMFTAYAIVTLLYILVVLVTVGVLDKGEFSSTLTPVSTGASGVLGSAGFILLASAAMLAFITTANAGLLAASRTPMAMSRDNLLPSFFGRINRRFGTPVLSIIVTSGFMITCIVFLKLEELVKVAATMQLILFTLEIFSVIVMRASKLVSYKPSFTFPLFPVLPAAGILIYIFLIVEMGRIPLLITAGFVVIAVLWYVVYARYHVRAQSAFLHMVGNLTNRDLVGDRTNLEDELLGILRERDEIEEDRFDSLVRNAVVLDMTRTVTRKEFFKELAQVISGRWGATPDEVEHKLTERENQTSTLIYPGVAVPHAIPHIVIDGKQSFDIVLVRNKFGIIWNEENEVVYTAFCLVGTKDERNFHLKALMSIAQILQDPEFHKAWMDARTGEELRSVILVTKRRRK